jgi:peptide/nickel transport system permease protein
MFLASVPAFWLGMMLLLLFSLKLGWFPTTGIASWKNFVLPMFALGLPYAAQQLRFTRSSMLETIRQDYIRTARAKGASERAVIWTHAMKNALLPVVTIIGVNFSVLLAAPSVTETLFGIRAGLLHRQRQSK